MAAQIAGSLAHLTDLARQQSWADDTPVSPLSFEDDHLEIKGAVACALSRFTSQLAALVAEEPNCLDHLECRHVEHMLATVFDSLGFDVELTPGSKDGGKDIVLGCVVSGRRREYIVEVKRWRSGKKVTESYITRFMRVAARERRDAGLFLANYGFSDDVVEASIEFAQEGVFLGDRERGVSLCRTYVGISNGLWLPSEELPGVLLTS